MRFLTEENLLALRASLDAAKEAGTINQTELDLIAQPLIHPSNLGNIVGNTTAIAALERIVAANPDDGALVAEFLEGIR